MGRTPHVTRFNVGCGLNFLHPLYLSGTALMREFKNEPSSPMRKAQRRTSATRRRIFWPVVLCSPWICYICYLFLVSPNNTTILAPTPTHGSELLADPGSPIFHITEHQFANETSSKISFLDLTDLSKPQKSYEPIGAILLVTSNTILRLETVLLPIIDGSLQISQVALVCSQDVLQRVRSTLRALLSMSDHTNHVEFILLPLVKSATQVAAVLGATSHITTDRILFLGERGLGNFDQPVQDLLISGTFSLPFGPRGFVSDKLVCLTPPENVKPVSFLVPPFVTPSSVLHGMDRIEDTETWATFGNLIARQRGDGVGGIVIAAEKRTTPCRSEVLDDNLTTHNQSVQQETHYASDVIATSSFVLSNNPAVSPGIFALLLSKLDDFRAFSRLACRLQAGGNEIHVLIYEEQLDHGIQLEGLRSNIKFRDCRLWYHAYDRGSTSKTTVAWLQSIRSVPDIVFAIAEENSFSQAISSVNSRYPYIRSTLIRLPRLDLPYCEWIGSLSVQELRNWHVPRVDVTVITNDRPHSLARLLTSLHKARYFGDTLNLRVNLEQDTDMETLQIVNELRWDRGAMFINHRVIHGGLLPAVVESWYPHSINSYGLILEDDVELSPLFYAWVKMTLLRYKYGKEENKSPRLFGISLYQQKNIEMKPGGRQPFNARTIFAAEHLADYDTPYLSQIPCSWGAIYFPEHWREFHSYLSVRLSELSFSIDQVVVPDIRSNKWTKSWKKYFIELVYLRGYVMLYPNYDHFISLSTNHLEVGSHVKDSPRDSYVQKKELFFVPLMPLSGEGESMILDLPGQRLPPYRSLPALDLLGDIASMELLLQRGRSRRTELFPSCARSQTVVPYDVRDLFCLENPL